MLRPLTEFNAMAVNVFNKVTLVPRAISTAIGDTFKMRSKSSIIAEGQAVEWKHKAGIKHPETGETLKSDQEIENFRLKMVQLTSVDDLSLKDIPIIFSDYKSLLMTFALEPNLKKE